MTRCLLLILAAAALLAAAPAGAREPPTWSLIVQRPGVPEEDIIPLPSSEPMGVIRILPGWQCSVLNDGDWLRGLSCTSKGSVYLWLNCTGWTEPDAVDPPARRSIMLSAPDGALATVTLACE